MRDVALEAARAAGRLLAERRPTTVRNKGAVDLVTEVDLACEQAIRDVLARHTPDIPVLGEEGGGAAGDTRWVVDPLDGTTNFAHGFPWYAVSIALEVDGALEVAVVLDAVRDDAYVAERGKGAFLGTRRLQVSDTSDLGLALLGTGFPYDRREPGRAEFYLRRVEAALKQAQGVRRAGAAALDLAMVAAGRLDGFWEFGLQWWDVAAGKLLIEEAGGVLTAHDGTPVDRMRPSPVAGNPAVHAALVAMLGAA